jgi:hypothetical protein
VICNQREYKTSDFIIFIQNNNEKVDIKKTVIYEFSSIYSTSVVIDGVSKRLSAKIKKSVEFDMISFALPAIEISADDR